MTEGQMVKYQSRDGQEIKLTFDTVKKYLVSGKSENVTHQEIMYFLGICKSRGLNPFKKDAYLIKYGSDPAAIVTSIDYFRSRAKSQLDCRGWEKGVIIETKDGEIKRTKGLVLEGEKILGGWFKAQPDGWTTPFELEVNLNGYIKKTREGRTTKFWQPENQPTMIAKVAEGQGLRTLWPDEFQGIYEKSEILPTDATPIDMSTSNGQVFEATKERADALKQKLADAAKDTTEGPKEGAGSSTNEAEVHVCASCGFKAASERGLKKHMTQQHDKDKEPPATDPPAGDADPEPEDDQSAGPKEDPSANDPDAKLKQPGWNSLWWFCPKVGSEYQKDTDTWTKTKQGIPIQRCLKCIERDKDCPNPAPPIPDTTERR